MPLGLHFGPFWERPGSPFGRSWASLGHSWGLLACLLATSGRPRRGQKSEKNAQTTHFCLSWCFWGSLGLVLAPLGLILDASGAVFSPPGRLPEVSSSPSSRVLGYSRDLPEICLKLATELFAPIALNPLRVRRSPRSVLQLSTTLVSEH